MSRLKEVNQVHARLLEGWRKAMDLVGPGPIEPHFEDACGAVAGLDARGEWADLGSGAGFPGVALAAAWPDARVALVESRAKRSVFLERVLAEARLSNARVCCQRSEELPRAVWDGLISRAYKPPSELIPEAETLLRLGGSLVVLLGSGARLAVPPGWDQLESVVYGVGDGSRLRIRLRWNGNGGA